MSGLERIGVTWTKWLLAYGRPDRSTDRIRKLLHQRFRLGFYHHPRQLFRPRVANNDAAIAIERALSSSDRICDRGNLLQRFFFAHVYVPDGLREHLEVAEQLAERFSAARNDLQNPQRRQQAVAGGGIPVAEQDVPALLASERRARLVHLFQHVLIAYRRTQHLDARTLQRG